MTTASAETIKTDISITDVIRHSGLTVIKRGSYLSTREHDSLVIFPATNSFYWYSRGIGGSVIDWVMLVEDCDFRRALEILDQGDIRPVENRPRSAPSPPQFSLAQDLHLRYHANLDNTARAWWHAQGIHDEAIARFFLGYCDYHPLYRQPTYTIPVIESGKLINVRHRLINATSGDKYRPECAGLPTALFNSDILTPELGGVVIVAGEKKVIVLWQYGIPAISSTAGCGHWDDTWTTRLQFCRKVYIAFDPGEEAAAWKLAARIGDRAQIVALPDKPDDFILAQGEQVFRQYLRSAEPYADRDYWEHKLGKRAWGRLLE